MDKNSNTCECKQQFYCKYCGYYKCEFCGIKINSRRGVSCIQCVRETKLQDEAMRLHDPVKGRFFLLEDMRMNTLHVVELEKDYTSKTDFKQCFLLQKYINEHYSCSLKDIADLIDNKLFRNPIVYEKLRHHLSDEYNWHAHRMSRDLRFRDLNGVLV